MNLVGAASAKRCPVVSGSCATGARRRAIVNINRFRTGAILEREGCEFAGHRFNGRQAMDATIVPN